MKDFVVFLIILVTVMAFVIWAIHLIDEPKNRARKISPQFIPTIRL